MPCFFSLAKVDSWVSANALVMGYDFETLTKLFSMSCPA